LLEDFDDKDPRKEDVQVIVNETIRCREIVKTASGFFPGRQNRRKNLQM